MNPTIVILLLFYFFSDFQKLEREARICRKLQHPNIGTYTLNEIDTVSDYISGKVKYYVSWYYKIEFDNNYKAQAADKPIMLCLISFVPLLFSVRLHDSIQEENFHYLVFDL